MSDTSTEVIAIDDDDDDEIRLVYAQVPPPSRFQQLKLQIDLLQALCQNSEPTPVEYHKFYKYAKKVRPTYSDATIFAAWKRALTLQLKEGIKNGKTNLACIRRNQPPTIPPIVDLTESNKTTMGPSPISPSLLEKHGLGIPHIINESEQTSPPVPVAFFANPIHHQNIMKQLEPLSPEIRINRICGEPNNKEISEITLNDNSDRVGNCLLKILNSSTQHSEGADTKSILEEEIVFNYVPSDELSSESDLFNQHESNTSTDSENSSLFDPSDWLLLSDCNDRLKGSDKSKKTATRKGKRNDIGDNLYNTPKKKINRHQVMSSCVDVPAKNSKKINSARKPNKKISMTEAEWELFKQQRKRQKLREKRALISKELEIIHNRLVDVLIPKYFNTSQKKNN